MTPDEPTGAPTLRAAQDWLRHGFAVVPIAPNGKKRPALDEWKHYQSERPTAEEIRDWFPARTARGVAVICGKVSGGLEVLDFDDATVYPEWHAAVIAAGLSDVLARCPLVETPRGGRHVYYRCEQIEPNRRLAKHADGTVRIETRGEGGYAVAPPSNGRVHPSGRPWKFLEGRPETVPTITPEQRGELLRIARTFDLTPQKPTAMPAAPVAPPHADERPGDRYDREGDFEAVLLKHGWIPTERRGQVGHWARPGKNPAAGHSATTNHDGQRGFYVFSSSAAPFESDRGYSPFQVYALLEHNGDHAAAARALAKAYRAQSTPNSRPDPIPSDTDQAPVWPDPIPLDDAPNPPAFPTDALPEPIHEFAEAVAEHTQTPPDLAALLALGALATACARTARIEGAPGWAEPLNSFACVALPSGSRKSAVVSACAAPIEGYEAEECERLSPEIARRAAERATLEARLQAATKRAATATVENRLVVENDRDEAARALAELREEYLPRLLCDDATPEVLSRLLCEQQGRIACLSAEGSILFEQAAGRYSENGAKLETYLKAHAGDTLRVDRVNRQSEHVREPALTLCLTVQPSVLAGAMARPDFRGRGLLARFLWSVPKPTIGYRKLATEPVPADVTARYAETLRRLLRRSPSDDPPALRLSPDAARAFLSYRERCERDLRPGERLEHLTDWGSKLPGLVLRIAGLLHLAEHPDAEAVSRETIEAAIRIGAYAEAHAMLAFAAMGADPVRAKAERLLRWIRAQDLQEFTAGEVYRANRATFERPADVAPVLDLLADLDHISEAPRETGAGRPSRRFHVNPKTRARNARNTPNPPEDPDIVHSVHFVQPDATENADAWEEF